MAETPPLQAYTGNCHCGLFRFTVSLPPLTQVYACDCSICTRNAYLWAFSPSHAALKAYHHAPGAAEGKPDDSFSSLKSYTFGNGTLTHKFCPKCGTSVVGKLDNAPEGKDIAINVRTFRGVDLDALEVVPYPGAGLEPQYKVPDAVAKYPIDAGDGQKIYGGNCHCGAVTYTARIKPLEEQEVRECNCSICSRNGYMWIYPTKGQVDIQGKDALVGYGFNKKLAMHQFCGTCGTSIFNFTDGFSEEMRDIRPVNVRTMNGVDIKALKINKANGRGYGGEYEFA